jgi:membrane associated rhomboid family serine protease
VFIIPVGNRVDWKRPPVVTLLLILVNCFVFFFLQAGDDRQDARATDYYYSTELPNWEFARYVEYLEKNDRSSTSIKFGKISKKRDESALIALENDSRFMRELHAGHLVTPQAPEFADWSAQRDEYESLRSFTRRYIYQVDEPSLVTAFTSAFMHASFDHLLGNIRLWS